MSIPIPDRFYDYILYYECGNNEKSNPSAWNKIGSLPAGSLLNAVNWNASGNNVGDGAGITRFGITPYALTAYKNWSRNQGFVLNNSSAWRMVVNYFWKNSYADQAANVACAIAICQGQWGGWSSTSLKNTCNELRNHCDKDKDASKITGDGYQSLAKLTTCFTNPMDAFLIIRSCRIAYLRSCSNASKFAGGWMRREFFAMQKDGLYCEPGSKSFTKYGFTPIPQMEQAAEQLKKDANSGYIELIPWNETPSSDLALNDISDGSNDLYTPPVGDISSSGGYTIGHGETINGGILDMSKLNVNNPTKGLILGITINQK